MNTLKDLLELDYETRSYSGRGMFGKSCLAVALEPGQSPFKVFSDILLNVDDEYEEVDEHGKIHNDLALVHKALRDARVDDLGFGTILYFPTIPFEE